MFLNIDSFFALDSAEKKSLTVEGYIDSLAVAIKLKTLVVPLGQKCPAKLQLFLEKEEEYRTRLKNVFDSKLRILGPQAAASWLKKFFDSRWQLLYAM